jgi:hypothetical protein
MSTPVNQRVFDIGVKCTSQMLDSGETVTERIEAFLEYVPGTSFNTEGTLSVTQTRLIFSGRKPFGRRNVIIHLADIASIELDTSDSLVLPIRVKFDSRSIEFGVHRFHQVWAKKFVERTKELCESIKNSASHGNDARAIMERSPGVFESEEHDLMWKKRKKIALLSVLGVGVLLIASSLIGSIRDAYKEGKVKDATAEVEILNAAFCDDMDAAGKSTTGKSLSRGEDLTDKYAEHLNQIRDIVDSKYANVSDQLGTGDLASDAYECYKDAFALSTPPTTSPPRQKSEAEIAAEGNTCAQQWRRAHSETLSGGSSDIQLRGTLYACTSLEDWVSEAFAVGEYSDGLLQVACLFEPDAPSELCG